MLAALASLPLVGCIRDPATQSTGVLEKVWGTRGNVPGQFQKPRALAIDANDELYIVDTTARIQVFTREGEYLRGWKRPRA